MSLKFEKSLRQASQQLNRVTSVSWAPSGCATPLRVLLACEPFRTAGRAAWQKEHWCNGLHAETGCERSPAQ